MLEELLNQQRLKGEFYVNDLENNILLEVISEIIIEADELMDDERTAYTSGQLLAYATALSIIRDSLSGYDLKEFGLDFDIDKKYICAE